MPGVWPLGPVVSWPAEGRRPLPPWPSSPPVLWSPRPGTFVSARDGVEWGSFPSSLFLPFLSLFSAAGHVSSSPKAGAEWVPACGQGTWWDSGGSVLSLRRTADLESDPLLGSVSLAVIIPAAHAAVTEAWDQLGAWGLRVREAVAFLGPIPPWCGPSPPLRAAGSRESLQRAGGFLWGLAPSLEYFTAGFYGILAYILFCFVLVSELLAGTAIFSLWDIFFETALLPSFPPSLPCLTCHHPEPPQRATVPPETQAAAWRWWGHQGG